MSIIPLQLEIYLLIFSNDPVYGLTDGIAPGYEGGEGSLAQSLKIRRLECVGGFPDSAASEAVGRVRRGGTAFLACIQGGHTYDCTYSHGRHPSHTRAK